MREAERLMQEIQSQRKTLEALLNYLESQERWSDEDLWFCRNTLRRAARELISISRGWLDSLDAAYLNLQ